MKRAILAALILAGCATHTRYGNEAGGTIAVPLGFSEAKAMKHADAECGQYGKIARSEGVNLLRNTLRYTCVAR